VVKDAIAMLTGDPLFDLITGSGKSENVMLVTNKQRFIQVPFDSEDEIENVVVENATDIFGADSIYFPKALIKTSGGTGTIPDGFAIDLAERRWFIVEAETSEHPVWDHIWRRWHPIIPNCFHNTTTVCAHRRDKPVSAMSRDESRGSRAERRSPTRLVPLHCRNTPARRPALQCCHLLAVRSATGQASVRGAKHRSAEHCFACGWIRFERSDAPRSGAVCGGKGAYAAFWLSSARPDQLIRKTDRIKGILTADGRGWTQISFPDTD
jgi:hypothetical protein